MATASSTVREQGRRNSIANLLLPQGDLDNKSLLSLSNLAATMAPVSPPHPSVRQRRPSTYRASPTPHHMLHTSAHAHHAPPQPSHHHLHHRPAAQPHASDSGTSNRTDCSVPTRLPDVRAPLGTTLPDDQRRATGRLPRPASLAAPSLGVSRSNSKRNSRSKSGLAPHAPRKSVAAIRAAAVASSSAAASSRRSPSPLPGPLYHQQQHAAATAAAAGASSHVLRPISANPLADYPSGSKQNSASNSVDSCAAPPEPAYRSPGVHTPFVANKAAFAAAARGMASDYASSSLARMRDVGGLQRTLPGSQRFSGLHPDSMDVDVGNDMLDQMEPSSSSHDAKLLSRPSRSKTTPDAKRAQNRESAKRFRVAQKKRWAELQETVIEKDSEISRLKCMLQEVTNRTLSSMHGGQIEVAAAAATGSAADGNLDALTKAEMELFVKLLGPQEEVGGGGSSSGARIGGPPPLAADIGSLHRVIVSKLNGSVLGVRHENRRYGAVMGGDVGGCLWEHVHSSDSAHLRASVVHAQTMMHVMGGQPSVFSYRRREREVGGDGDRIEDVKRKDCYIRMKGCLYPLMDDDGKVGSVILAEFIEL